MGKVNLLIDGKKIQAEKGSTILEAALTHRIEIPHLCYQPGLSIAGACRVCLVKIKGEPGLVPSCATLVQEGMEITANDEELKEVRRQMVELILSERPHDCLVCESNGQCELQDLAYNLGIEEVRFPKETRRLPIEDSSEVIFRDPNKCILCSRCVRACSEITVQGVLDFANRGSETLLISGLAQPLSQTDCVSCGACIQACPTGALTEKLARFRGRSWEFRQVRTVCPYCGVGCQIELQIKNNKIVKVYGVPDGPDNKGHLCVKGRFGFDFVHHPDRLTHPLIKRKGKFEASSWDEALDLIAHKFRHLREKYGPDALAGLSSAKCTNEENFLFQKFMRAVIGTNNVDHCARLCHASTVAALGRAFGSGAMTNSIQDLAQTELILLTGSNTTENHPVIGNFIKHLVKFKGIKLIVVDPRKIELSRYADIWLRPKSGTDVAWINGLANVIIKDHLHNREFIGERTENFDEFEKIVSKYTPEKVEEISGIPKEKLLRAARMYGKANRASIIFAMGITQHITGTDNILSLANLAMLTGNVGREGTGVNPLRGQNNVQGACDVGALPDVYPGYQKVTDPAAKEKFEKSWGIKLSSKEGLTVVEITQAARAGRIKGLYIMGENPILSDPNINHVREGLTRLDFLVVQDIFLTETAKLAHVVLPAASFAEKEGTFTNTVRRIQRVRKAVPGPGEALQDWEIIVKLSQRMDYKMKYTTPEEIMDETASLTPIYGGVHWDRLKGEGLQWPCPHDQHPGTPYLHKGRFSRGKGLFSPIDYIPPAELPDEEYPFLLSTGRLLYHFHTASMSRRSLPLSHIIPEGFMEINPRDAKRLMIKAEDRVRVSSRRGSIEIKVKVTPGPNEGMVFIPFHFSEAAANILTNDALDPVAKIPEYKVAAVKIERITP